MFYMRTLAQTIGVTLELILLLYLQQVLSIILQKINILVFNRMSLGKICLI